MSSNIKREPVKSLFSDEDDIQSKEELLRRGITRKDITTSLHAVNSLSRYNEDKFREGRIGAEGIVEWIVRIAKKAMIHGVTEDDNIYIYEGLKFVIMDHTKTPDKKIVVSISSSI